MPKFCHECGAKLLDENVKFCSECGIKIKKEVPIPEKVQEIPSILKTEPVVEIPTISESIVAQPTPSSPEVIVKKKKNPHNRMFGIFAILLGLAIIFMIFMTPLFKIGGRYYSLINACNYCMLDCEFYYAMFFIGGIIAIVAIIYGIAELILGAGG